MVNENESIIVSIIIVNYNTKDLLLSCIMSVQESKEQNLLEIIVVDNASTDGSEAMMRDLFPNIRLIVNDQNMGFAFANNQGMREAEGDCFFLLNSDAILRPGTLNVLVDFMTNHSKVAFVGPKVEYPDGRLQYTAGPSLTLIRYIIRALGFIGPKWIRSVYRKARSSSITDLSKPIRVESISAVALLVNRCFFEESGGFDENYFMYVEDVDWALRASKTGWGIWYVPTVSVVHLDGGSSGGKYREYNPQALKSLIYFFQKHKGLLGNITLRITGLIINILKLAIGLIICLATLGTKGRKLLKQAWGSTLVFVMPLSVKTKVVKESA